MKKCLFLFGVLGLAIMSAKSYDVSLAAPATVGNNKLTRGEYKVEVNGSKAVFTNAMDPKKTFEANVKVENVGSKFEHTAIESRRVAGEDHIKQIQLGGTKLQLDFN